MSSGGPGLPLCTCVSAAALRSQVLARTVLHAPVHSSLVRVVFNVPQCSWVEGGGHTAGSLTDS